MSSANFKYSICFRVVGLLQATQNLLRKYLDANPYRVWWKPNKPLGWGLVETFIADDQWSPLRVWWKPNKPLRWDLVKMFICGVCHLERSRNPRSIERSDNVRGLAALAARILRLMQLSRTTKGRPYGFGIKYTYGGEIIYGLIIFGREGGSPVINTKKFTSMRLF